MIISTAQHNTTRYSRAPINNFTRKEGDGQGPVSGETEMEEGETARNER